ncbi:MAG: protein phosphatase 2C domain-containing protein [Succinivibrionaceae bacterium]|nr:protein phosphatase 2C domain-containing protein [Succinivibrionaceae bacterium]
MTFFFLIGTPGSMAGRKIGAVNESMRELLPNISDISAANPDAEINVAVLQFSKGASWIYKEPKPASDFEWNDLSAAGASADLGEACRELNSKLSKNGFMKSASGSYAPGIILISDSEPTDDFEAGLAELKKNGWFRGAIKIAIAIGDDANKEKLAQFTGTSEAVFTVHNIGALKKMIRFVAVTSSQVDEKRTMKAIFSRCRGASHEISGEVCQDYCQAEVTDSYTIGVVSDGHGGDRYFRSDIGSKSAVEATLECVREFVQTADESLFSGAPLTQCGTVAAEREKNGSGMGDERYALFRQLFSSIICKWHERILEDARRPATPEEREKLPEQVAAFERTDSEGHRTGIEQTYGCTLMCFARTKSYWFAFHIGNGKCVALSVDSGRIENSEPVPWDEKCFRNVTTSLCDPEALDKFRYCYGGKDTLPLAVFLGSDGIDDSIPAPADMANFHVNILKLLGRYSEADAKKELDDTLPALSRRGSKDDMSVVCCYDDEALKSEVNTLVEWQRGNVRTEMQAVRERLDELTRKLSASLKLLAPVTGAIVQQRKCWQADIEKARKELDRLAFREAKLSAELGEVEAERNLAQMYEEGRGTEKDLKKALEWYSTAAEQHNDMAADAVEMRNKPEVKLHNVMKQLLRQFGSAVLQDERLLSLLDDCHAFEDFPAMRQVMKEFASRGYLRDLYCRSQKDGIAECQLYADYVKKSLCQTRHFRSEFADYAVDSVFFALGLTDSVSEPSDHGFDPAAEYADWADW